MIKLNKKQLCLWAFTCNIFLVSAQTFFSEGKEHLIYYSPDIAPTAVCVEDMDGDGDQDILSFFNEKFRLFTSSDSKGTFIEQELITALDDWILSLDISDLNGDGKKDIVAASYNNDRIIWYENDGTGVFGAQQIISGDAEGAISVIAEDLDRDGDQDVISASLWDNKIAWYKNTGGGVFGEQQVITSLAEGARMVYVADLDADTLPDIISASIYNHQLAWYQNLGEGVFSEPKIISDSAARVLSVHTTDIDGNGTLDVLTAASWGDRISWYKNDGDGNFPVHHVISNTVESAQSVFATDLDEDGDPDVLSASLWDNKIAWYENDGTGGFGEQQVVSRHADGPGFVFATDIDGDGFRDIVSASTDFKIAWYENTLPLKILVNPADTAIEPDHNATFDIVAEAATGYQWQCRDNNEFYNLEDDGVYSGVQTHTLFITDADETFQGNEYRCIAINGEDSLFSKKASLIILDTEDPVITSSPTDTAIVADWNCRAELPDFTVISDATDNSYEMVTITQDPVPYTKVTGLGVEVSIIATDGAGNSSQVTFLVDVLDTVPPVFMNVPGPRQLDDDGNGQYFLPDFTDTMTVIDNCSDIASIAVLQEPAPGMPIPDTVYNVAVVVRATDEGGNDTEVSFNAYTIDQVPPVITSLHPDVSVDGNSMCLAILPDFTGDVEANDNLNASSDLIISQEPSAGKVISGPENQVILTVMDLTGNTAEVSFNVEVSNKISVSCLPDQIIDLEEGDTSYTVSRIEFDPISIALDCGLESLTNNINSSSSLDQVEFFQDTTEVIWILADDAGNTAQCSFLVILKKSVGMEEVQQDGIFVYPNPTVGELHIESALPIQYLRLVDLAGKVIIERADIQYTARMDISGYGGGTYILSIHTDKEIFKQLIFKE